MSLYGKTDSNENLDKVVYASALTNVLPQADVIFVDNTEAALVENKARGVNAPGWWRYFTFTDCEGVTRHKAELLVTIADPESNAAESQADDTVAADASFVITIDTQPEDQTEEEGTTAMFIVEASVTGSGSPTLAYQWQRRTTASGRWTNISGATADTLEIENLELAWDSYQYRVKVTSSNGAPEVISDTAVLYVTEAP